MVKSGISRFIEILLAGSKLILLVLLIMLILTPACTGFTSPEALNGDLNKDGRVDVLDVVKLMRHVLGLESLGNTTMTAADLNGDGKIDVRDATLLMQVSLGLDKVLREQFKLGSEILLSEYAALVVDRRVGLVTNQSGVNSRGESTIDLLNNAPRVDLVALYAPEHGLDGKAKAGEYVESYTHPQLGIPVYSLYGSTRMPTEEMLASVEILLFDIQDIGARSYTYISTLNYCMVAAEKYNIPIVVLDRPNPLGGLIVEGPMMEERYISFVGVDILPMAHGMTAGELARYFNRKIGVELTVVPMRGYERSMVFHDTGLEWVQTSPNIPDIDSVFGYMIAGLGENTGVFQADQFKWVGGRGLNSDDFAARLNTAGLTGVEFIPEQRGEAGGVKIIITDYHLVNTARTGIYALTIAFELGDFNIPRSNETIVMFDKIIGTDKLGDYLAEELTPNEIEARFAPAVEQFKVERAKYLIPDYTR